MTPDRIEENKFVYREITSEEKKIKRVEEFKKKLANTDYQAIKYAEGELAEEEYAPIKAQRKAWREEINRIEEELNNGNE